MTLTLLWPLIRIKSHWFLFLFRQFCGEIFQIYVTITCTLHHFGISHYIREFSNANFNEYRIGKTKKLNNALNFARIASALLYQKDQQTPTHTHTCTHACNSSHVDFPLSFCHDLSLLFISISPLFLHHHLLLLHSTSIVTKLY